jgi:hypothetical protein
MAFVSFVYSWIFVRVFMSSKVTDEIAVDVPQGSERRSFL